MATAAGSVMFSDEYSHAAAFVGAKLCQATYATSTAALAEFRDAIGAASSVGIPQAGLIPPCIVWRLPTDGYIVSWGGIGCLRQFLAYIALSRLVLDTTHFGAVSNFIKYCVDTQWAAILAALGGGAASTPPVKISIVGHSAGGACAAYMASRLITNYSTAFDVRSVYAFSNPKPGNGQFCNAIHAGSNSNSFRFGADPIPKWPSQGSGILATAIGATIPGVAAFNSWSDYRDLPTCWEIQRAGGTVVREVQTFGRTGDDEIANLIISYIELGTLPPSHRIETVVEHLFPLAAKEAAFNETSGVNNLIDSVYALNAEVDNTQADLSSGALPPLSQFRDIPGLGAGVTQRFGNGVVRVSGGAGLVITANVESHNPRAKKGDGHTKKRVKEIFSRMRRVQEHDDAVRRKTGRTEIVLLNRAKLSAEELTAWATVYTALERVTSEWGGTAS